MDRTVGPLRNTQKYSAVENHDFEEASLKETSTRRAAEVLTPEPSQSAWLLAAKFLVSSEVLVVHLAWLLVLILSIFCLQFFTSGMSCPISELQSDERFGKIPYRVVSWEENRGFVDSDPLDGKRWNMSREGGTEWTPWDDIHPGSWVAVKPSSKLGISGGIPLREYSRDGSWNTDDEGFALSMHHQIHCLGLMKHVFVNSEQNKTITNGDYRHMDHCVEYIRQAILCNGDTTLEPLGAGATRTAIESNTWGSKHICRDWGVLQEVIWKHTNVGFDKYGYVYNKELV